MIEVTTDKTKILTNIEKDIQKHKEAADKYEGMVHEHWYEMGRSLCKVRDQKLHPQRTFEQYCLQRWDIKRAYAYRLCRAFETVKLLKDSDKSTIVDNKHEDSKMSVTQADELSRVPEAERVKVLKDAKKSGKVTAKSIKTAARKKSPKDVIETDKIGRAIPTPAMEVWGRRNELDTKLRPLYELKNWANDMQGTTDILYRAIDFGALMRELGQVILMIQQGVPDVVCTKCQGQATETCDFCKGRGMVAISKARAYTPVEIKKMVDQTTSNDSTERLSATGG